MIISTDPARVQLAVVYPWLRTSYWSPNVKREVVERAFRNSLVAGAYEGDVQVGIARAVSDRATFAWLCDVFVAEPARGRGVARNLVQTLIDHPELATVRRWSLATRDAHEVYRPLGFGPVDPKIFMQFLPDPARWSD
jgi:GNAT superfamily N-acetyltransferase